MSRSSRRKRKQRMSELPKSAPVPPDAGETFGKFFSRVGASAKRATTQVLDAVEKDPERALAGVGQILSEGERMIQSAKNMNQTERRELRNNLISLAAKGIKKAIEKA